MCVVASMAQGRMAKLKAASIQAGKFGCCSPSRSDQGRAHQGQIRIEAGLTEGCTNAGMSSRSSPA
jgi:hypothetical protein